MSLIEAVRPDPNSYQKVPLTSTCSWRKLSENPRSYPGLPDRTLEDPLEVTRPPGTAASARSTLSPAGGATRERTRWPPRSPVGARYDVRYGLYILEQTREVEVVRVPQI